MYISKPAHRFSTLALCLIFATFAGCASTHPDLPGNSSASGADDLEIVARLDQAPGNLTVTSDARIIVSLHQHFNPDLRVVEVLEGGRLAPFPNSDWNAVNSPDSQRLDSVLGVQYDTKGVLWMLDNGMRSGITPKLVGWDIKQDRLYKVIELPKPITLENSFLNDLAVDSDNSWLYYGPMFGTAMYRVPTADLINTTMPPSQLAESVQRFGNKPISDGSSMNHAGEIYISDIGNNAIGLINRQGSYVQLFQNDALINWPDAFSFGPDDWCYVVINQLHRGPVLNAGSDESVPPFLIARFKQDTGGVIGR
jgi:hypothetical protein